MNRKSPLNTSGLLLMNYDQLIDYHQSVIKFLTSRTLQESRILEWKTYVSFVRAVLGVDIRKNPELDPFKELSGFTAYEFLVKKWEKQNPAKGFLGCLRTDFMSVEHLQNLYGIEKKTDDEGFWEDPIFMNTFDAPVVYRPVGTRFVGDDWEFRYGTISYYLPKYHKSRVRPRVQKGVIFLEPEPLARIKETPEFSLIYKMLCDISTWMSHDVLGHMVLDFYPGVESPEAECYRKLKKKDLSSWEVFYGSNTTERIEQMRFLFDEHRRGSAHLELAKIFFQRKPILRAAVKGHMAAFRFTLSNAVSDKKTFSYFMTIYIFCMIRIMPHRSLGPWMYELGVLDLFESLWRKNKFDFEHLMMFTDGDAGAPYNRLGMKAKPEEWTRDNVDFIPHKEFFTQVHERLVSV